MWVVAKCSGSINKRLFGFAFASYGSGSSLPTITYSASKSESPKLPRILFILKLPGGVVDP
jgi:hypothetical protein